MTATAKILFLITARGGSKGVPAKNLQPVGGIPLVGRSCRVARAAAGLAAKPCRIVCSTDSPEIAQVARAWGAEVPFFRPAELASDAAKSVDVVFHVLDTLGERFDLVVLIQPTSPFVEAEDVAGAIQLYEETGQAVVSVCRNEHPLAWSYFMDSQRQLTPVMGNQSSHQRQGAAVSYRTNGAVFVATPSLLRAKGRFVVEGTLGFVMPAERSIDIDTPCDLHFARALLAQRQPAPLELAAGKIGPGCPCFVIAEAGVNHNGDPEVARRLIDAAAEAGADAVGFHAGKAAAPTTAAAPRRLELPLEAFRGLQEYAAGRGIMLLSTPFDHETADDLDRVGVPAIRVPRGEITNLPFLAYLARKGKPLIASTGMSTLAEVNEAVGAIRAAGNPPLALLHCASNDPASPADANLRAMTVMAQAFRVPVGYCDHVLGNEAALAAVALGASILEKPFTLDRSLPGPDHQASLEPGQLAALVRAVRRVEAALGDGCQKPVAAGVAR